MNVRGRKGGLLIDLSYIIPKKSIISVERDGDNIDLELIGEKNRFRFSYEDYTSTQGSPAQEAKDVLDDMVNNILS